MMIYPAQFPCPSRVEGHSAVLTAGLVRTPMEAGNTRQRRLQRVLPHQIALVFMIDQAAYASWFAWVNAYAWDDWITMALPGLLASKAAAHTTPVPVRFMSDLQAELVAARRLWYWRVRVGAEYLPTPEDFPVVDGLWIAGDTPQAPAPDWVRAGTPGAHALLHTNPGTPATPTVLI